MKRLPWIATKLPHATQPPSGRYARLNQASLVGCHDSLDAIPKAKLHQHVRDVRLDRGLAYVQGDRNLVVGQSAPDLTEHLHLAWSQLVEERDATRDKRPSLRE